MSKDYSIQLFEEKDLDDVVKINWTCLPENYDNSFFLTLFYHYPKTFVVANQVGKGVIGYIMGRIETGFSELKRFSLTRKGHVVSIAVLPESRNKGVASSLLNKALEGFREYKVSEIFLEVRESNKIAIDLYQKFGFNVSRQVKGYYRDGETAYIMTKVSTT
jgi:ribosomal-protein-alanine N-acetyltransferase